MNIMRNLTLRTLLFVISLSVLPVAGVTAQDFSSSKKIDPSNAGNLYTQINTGLEYKHVHGAYNLYGMRVNGQYAFNPNNLLLFEVPVMYNDKTEKFGVSDLRVLYYSAVWRHPKSTFSFLIPFIDVTIPTGSYTHGLGSGRWTFTTGLITGVILNKRVSIFPGLGYIHSTKNRKDIPGDTRANGFSIQTNASVKLSRHSYVFINPIFAYIHSFHAWKANWSGELNYNYMIKPTFKINARWNPDFTNKSHLYRLGTTFYF